MVRIKTKNVSVCQWRRVVSGCQWRRAVKWAKHGGLSLLEEKEREAERGTAW